MKNATFYKKIATLALIILPCWYVVLNFSLKDSTRQIKKQIKLPQTENCGSLAEVQHAKPI